MKNKLYIIGFILMCLYYLPFFIFGENSYIVVHDNLDISVVNQLLIKLYAGASYHESQNVTQIMNGLPYEMLFPSLNLGSALFRIFDPFLAYLINDFLARLVGFAGMMLLLDHHVIAKNSKYRDLILFLGAFLFSILGSYNLGGLVVMGQPLILFLFWNLYQGEKRWWYYLIITVFAFWSSFVLSGIFICISLTVWWAFGFIKNKQLNMPFLGGVILLGLSSIIAEPHLILSVLNPGSISHRTEFQQSGINFLSLLKQLFHGFYYAPYHAGMFITIPIVAGIAFEFLLYKKLNRLSQCIIAIIMSILAFGFLYQYLVLWLGEHIRLIKMVQWDRFYFILPLLWIMLFAVSLEKLLNYNRQKRLIIILAFVFSFLMYGNVAYFNREIRYNLFKMVGIKIEEPTYQQFYDPALFSRIKEYIGLPLHEYRIISLGLFPSIGTYNGFFSLDAYQVSYPLIYKHQFRELISKELDKNAEIKDYFDNWGSRCYLFSAELGADCMWSKDRNGKVTNLEFNTPKFKEMGGKYILSAVEIKNSDLLGLTPDKIFEGDFWKIYLYQVQ
jgi:hypothetical protein